VRGVKKVDTFRRRLGKYFKVVDAVFSLLNQAVEKYAHEGGTIGFPAAPKDGYSN
jgi:hypothetical protein